MKQVTDRGLTIGKSETSARTGTQQYLIELKLNGSTLAEFRVGAASVAKVCRLLRQGCPADQGFVLHIYRNRPAALVAASEPALPEALFHA